MEKIVRIMTDLLHVGVTGRLVLEGVVADFAGLRLLLHVI